MEEFEIKDGNIPPELLDFITNNEKETILVKLSLANKSPSVRLRGAFHAVLTAWFNSGMFSCQWNDKPIRTIGGLKKYYKYYGCQGKCQSYSFSGEETKDINFFYRNLPEKYWRFISHNPIGWELMSKKQQSRALNIMLSEINHASMNGDLTTELRTSIALLEKDVKALQAIGYYKYKAEFAKEKI